MALCAAFFMPILNKVPPKDSECSRTYPKTCGWHECCQLYGMINLTNNCLYTFCEIFPDFQPSPEGGRHPVSKRNALAGIFWGLEAGAKVPDSASANGSFGKVKCFLGVMPSCQSFPSRKRRPCPCSKQPPASLQQPSPPQSHFEPRAHWS